MKTIQTIHVDDIEKGDLIKIQNLQSYVSSGDEVTDLVELFADKILVVDSIDNNRNEWGERTVMANNLELGTCSFTDHEIASAYRIMESV